MSQIGLAYDDLFVDATTRSGHTRQSKGLAGERGRFRKGGGGGRNCLPSAGELSAVQGRGERGERFAPAGDQMTPLLDVVNKQLDLAEQGVAAPCK